MVAKTDPKHPKFGVALDSFMIHMNDYKTPDGYRLSENDDDDVKDAEEENVEEVEDPKEASEIDPVEEEEEITFIYSFNLDRGLRLEDPNADPKYINPLSPPHDYKDPGRTGRL